MARIENKKIALLVTQSKFGGAQKYVLQLAAHFSKRNEVLILVGEAKNRDEQFFAAAQKLNIRVLVLEHLIRDVSLVQGVEAVLELRRLLARERPDILHLNSSMGGALGSLAAWLANFDPLGKTIRVIYTVHGFVFNEPLPSLKRRVYIAAEKISAGFKGALIAVSDFDRKTGIEHRIAPSGRFVVIHTGVDASEQFLSRADARRSLSLDPATYVVGAVASLYPTKNIGLLVRAAAKLKKTGSNIRFVVIGDGPEHNAISESIKTQNVTDIFGLKGHLTHAQRYLKAFDVLALPSIKEGFPYILLEAGLASVPVIASNVGGIPELITTDQNGMLFASGDVHGLTEAIIRYRTNPSDAQLHAQRLRERVLSEFTIQRMLEETENVYDKLMAAGRPQQPVSGA